MKQIVLINIVFNLTFKYYLLFSIIWKIFEWKFCIIKIVLFYKLLKINAIIIILLREYLQILAGDVDYVLGQDDDNSESEEENDENEIEVIGSIDNEEKKDEEGKQ